MASEDPHKVLPEAVVRYHDGTKHHFHRFAPSLGYLDWASQPDPFRSFAGASPFPLWPNPEASDAGYEPSSVTYDGLFGDHHAVPAPLNAASLGDVLRHALGLSAWKVFQTSRWSLRANPSSGNLHPTEAYVVCGAASGLDRSPAVYHYAPDRHVLELRCHFSEHDWQRACGEDGGLVLVALTSIHWREAWKYGERAFRYCQHDLGHAMAALALSARLVGWRAHPLPVWSHHAMATLTGIDRDEDFVDAEREEPGTIMAFTTRRELPPAIDRADSNLIDAVSRGSWTGRASQLSEAHVQWTFIDEIAKATEWPGLMTGESGPGSGSARGHAEPRISEFEARHQRKNAPGVGPRREWKKDGKGLDADARALTLQRRSAVAFDGVTRIDRATFLSILSRVIPRVGGPWDAIWWTPRVHLALFVHRVDDLDPGLYLLVRDEMPDARASSAFEPLRAACGLDFLWERMDDHLPLYCLARGDCTRLAERLSCDQAIAADGCFSLSMLADFERSLGDHGPGFYRNLFWETGAIGQVLYLEAEAAGIRATGIGCFYDDPVHDMLGLKGHAFQSLYHFTMGGPVEDARLTTERGYPWG